MSRKLPIPFLALGLTTLAACGGEQAGTEAEPPAAESATPVALELAGGNPAAETAVATITADYLRETIEDAELGFWTGLAIANADEMPTWAPGDEFEAARLEALQE